MKNLLYLFILIMVSCKSSSTAESGSPQAVNSTSDQLEPMYCAELEDAENYGNNIPGNSTTLLNYRLVNNCFCVKYQYSGCNEGEPLMVRLNTHKSGNTRPVVMSRILVKDAGLCDQLLTDSVCFSMKRLHLVGNEVLLYINNKQNSVIVKAPQN